MGMSFLLSDSLPESSFKWENTDDSFFLAGDPVLTPAILSEGMPTIMDPLCLLEEEPMISWVAKDLFSIRCLCYLSS
jgi:hypothetical protein